MDYSEEAYQELLKMRANGKKICDEERYTESLTNLAFARKTFEAARQAYDHNSTEEFCDLVNKARTSVERLRNVSNYLRAVMEGKINDPNMSDTMYELRGYKEKEECDKIFSEWTQRVCPQGYWTPGM
jgi:hypothetical protein